MKTSEKGTVMNADKITAAIDTNIKEAPEHDEELRALMTPPVPETFEGVNGENRQLWIVGKYEEYFLTFDETSGLYGLAYKTILNELVTLGGEGGIGEVYETLIEQ